MLSIKHKHYNIYHKLRDDRSKKTKTERHRQNAQTELAINLSSWLSEGWLDRAYRFFSENYYVNMCPRPARPKDKLQSKKIP